MNCKNKSFIKKRAFTLIELLIVIAIIGILFIVLVSKVDFATDKAKATGVQTDFRSFQMAFDTVAKENAGFNTFGWDTGDANQNGKRDSYDEGDNGAGGGTAKNGIQDGDEVFTGHKVYDETFTKVYSLKKNGTGSYDRDALNRLETAINANLDPKLHITIKDDGEIVMANGAQDPWNKEYHGEYITNAESDGKDRGAIVLYSDGANNEFGSEHTIANGVVSISIPGNNVYGKDDMSIVSCYTYVNGYGEVKNITTGFSNNQGFLADGNNLPSLGVTPDTDPEDQQPENPVPNPEFPVVNSSSLKGTWVLNDVLTSMIDLDLDVSFISYLPNGQLIYGTKLYMDVTTLSYTMGYGEDITQQDVYYSDTGWLNSSSKTIIFMEDCNHANLKEWINANAIKTSEDVVMQDVLNTWSNLVNNGSIVVNNNSLEYVSNNVSGVLVIPEGIKRIEHEAFKDCNNITEIYFPDSLTFIDEYVFYNINSSIENIYFSATSNLTHLKEGVFGNLKNLKTVTLPENLTIIDQFAFEGVNSIESIYIPKSVVSIGNSAFSCNENLVNVSFAENSSLYMIEPTAFLGCDMLEHLRLPKTVGYIGDRAFYNCNSLMSLEFEGTIAEWNNITFEIGWNDGLVAECVVCSDGVVYF